MKFGVCVFPGSNCDYDTYYVLRDVVGAEVRFLDFRETKLQNIDCVVLPGGFPLEITLGLVPWQAKHPSQRL